MTGGTPDPGVDLLAVHDLTVRYGSIAAVKGVSLSVPRGAIVCLIGSNGAGKSTSLRTISGLMRAHGGRIEFDGRDITRAQSHEIVRLGVAQSPEGRRIFPRMTVAENLELGAFTRSDRDGIAADRERVLDLFPRLAERIAQTAGTLSGGEQQMLAVGRAMMARPKLMLLDEPCMGLAPVLVDLILATIVRIREQGVTVLLVEQNARAALAVSDHAYVMESGRIRLSGRASDLARDPAVVAAYLGG